MTTGSGEVILVALGPSGAETASGDRGQALIDEWRKRHPSASPCGNGDPAELSDEELTLQLVQSHALFCSTVAARAALMGSLTADRALLDEINGIKSETRRTAARVAELERAADAACLVQ